MTSDIITLRVNVSTWLLRVAEVKIQRKESQCYEGASESGHDRHLTKVDELRPI